MLVVLQLSCLLPASSRSFIYLYILFFSVCTCVILMFGFRFKSTFEYPQKQPKRHFQSFTYESLPTAFKSMQVLWAAPIFPKGPYQMFHLVGTLNQMSFLWLGWVLCLLLVSEWGYFMYKANLLIPIPQGTTKLLKSMHVY